MNRHAMSRYYEHYIAFKNWTATEAASGDQSFEIETKRAGLEPTQRVLELGFGQGRFLDWCRLKGFDVSGVEIIEALVDAARARGHKTWVGPLKDDMFRGNSFDLVVAFDVLEHLTYDEVSDVLRIVRTILTPNGRVLVRFPNGASPFSLVHQTGDVTHRCTLSADSLDQIAQVEGFRLDAAYNSARTLPAGLVPSLRRRAVYALRDLIELVIGFAYFGKKIPLDPNLTAVLVIDQK
jgi:2-polyprenyl-3-methyl-5-hydroxy-6-metoxy-1,4-benzoquinol methylase